MVVVCLALNSPTAVHTARSECMVGTRVAFSYSRPAAQRHAHAHTPLPPTELPLPPKSNTVRYSACHPACSIAPVLGSA